MKSTNYTAEIAASLGREREQLSANPFVEGDEIAWSSIINGKVTRLKGRVIEIVGETMCCIGKCVASGKLWRDYVSVHDKSINPKLK